MNKHKLTLPLPNDGAGFYCCHVDHIDWSGQRIRVTAVGILTDEAHKQFRSLFSCRAICAEHLAALEEAQ